MPVQLVAVILNLPLKRGFPRFYHRIVCRLMGLDVVVHGTPSPDQPVLFVGNHVSYLDITVLSSVLQTSFVAKAEIAGWPLIGWLAKLQRTVFVERRSRHARDQRDSIAARLAEGDNLILFPEGTSGDGVHVLPFKSALFSVAERRRADGHALPVQPFSLAYTHLDGLPIGRDWSPLYAWYGDMALGRHLWCVLGLGRARVQVIFHPPLTVESAGSRKALADHCRHVVAEGVAAAHRGAPPPVASGDGGSAAAGGSA